MEVLYASCRKNFGNPLHASDRNLYRDADGHDISEDDFLAKIQGKIGCVLFHGYRSENDCDKPYYTDVLDGMRLNGIDKHYDFCVGDLWPGGRLRIGFPLSERRADRCAKFPATMIHAMTEHGTTVDVQTHSMGARLALEALSRKKDLQLRNLLMLAPAVADECIELGEKYGRIVAEQTKRTTVFFSKRDKVLEFMFPPGEALTGHPDFALGFHGAEHVSALPPNVSQIDCTGFIDQHSAYRQSQLFHVEWATVLNA